MSTTSSRITPAVSDSTRPCPPLGRQLHHSRRGGRAANESAETRSSNRRTASKGFVILALQAGAVLTLVGLTFALLWGQAHDHVGELAIDHRPALTSGEVARRTDIDRLAASPRPIDDPDRIKRMWPVGGTYEVLLKGGFAGFARDQDAGTAKRVHLAFAFEMQARREIESNDGRRIVEILAFDKVRAAKLLSQANDLALDLGPPGVSIFHSLDHLRLDAGTTMVPTRPVAEAILAAPAEAVFDDADGRAFLQVGALSGKRLRITHVDGIGVESIEPVGCRLTASDRDYLFHAAVFPGAYLLPNENDQPGGARKVDASQLATFLDPSMRAIPRGHFVVERLPNCRQNARQYADLRVQGDTLWMDLLCCERPCFISGLEGTLCYDPSDGRIETASLRGEFCGEGLPEEHLLFQVSARPFPRLTLSYCCRPRVLGVACTAR